MLSCRTVAAYLDDHGDEEASAAPLAAAGVRVHLRLCADCSRYLAQIKMVAATLGGIEARGVSAPTKARLMERFRAWRAGVDKVDNVDRKDA